MTDNQKRDQELYFMPQPDADFSPAHNKAVVENSIKKYDTMVRKRIKESREGNAERIDAVASYIMATRNGKIADIEKYFGKKYTSYLRGDSIREQVMERLNRPDRS